MNTRRIVDVLDSLSDELNLLAERLVFLRVHLGLVGQVNHDDLAIPHSLSNLLLIQSPFLGSVSHEDFDLFMSHYADDFVNFSLLELSSLPVPILFEDFILHIFFPLLHFFDVLLVPCFVRVSLLPDIGDKFCSALLKNANKRIRLLLLPSLLLVQHYYSKNSFISINKEGNSRMPPNQSCLGQINFIEEVEPIAIKLLMAWKISRRYLPRGKIEKFWEAKEADRKNSRDERFFGAGVNRVFI